MTEVEMKLLLLRYNLLSKERAKIVHKCVWARVYTSYKDEWEEYIDEMMKMEDDLRKDGYEFICTGTKAAGEVSYRVYEIVPIDNN